jgi:hypothetical protein
MNNDWIPVGIALPRNNSIVWAWDSDSLTPEKKLLYNNGRFLFVAHGCELDHTEFITKWKYRKTETESEPLIGSEGLSDLPNETQEV